MTIWLVAGMVGLLMLRKLLQRQPRMTMLFIGLFALFGQDLYAVVQPHPVVQALEARLPDPGTLDALQNITQRPVAVSVDDCAVEDMARCYRERNTQVADQMTQLLDVLNELS